MSDYIKRWFLSFACLHDFETVSPLESPASSSEWVEGMKDALDDLDRVPSADVVEVVRCKDCKHHEEVLNNNDGKVLCWVHDIDVIVDRNGYCSYGERKDNE